MKRTWIVGAVVVVLALAGGLAYRARHPPLPPPPSDAEIQELEARRDAKRDRLTAILAADREGGLADAPRGGVMVGIPVSVTESIAQQIVSGVFRETRVVLPEVNVRKEGEVEAKLLWRQKVGEFVLDVNILEATFTLKPGKPVFTAKKGRFEVAIPLDVAEGTGRVSIGFKWDSKGLAANVVCGDLDIIREVTGRVIPTHHDLKGAFEVGTEGGAVVLEPDFGELEVRLQVEPTEEAWAAVDALVAEQRGLCRMALDKIDIKKVLADLVGRGFAIKVPKKLHRPIVLPAGLRESAEVQGVKLAVDINFAGLAITPDRLWYAADVSTKSDKGGGPAPVVQSPGQPKGKK